ncbi:Kelch motif protein [compost metagenome]
MVGEALYLLGGYNNSTGTYLNSLERALINSDGTYGAFTTAGNLTAQRSAPTNVVIGNALYVLGGYNGGYLNTIERSLLP